MNNTIVELVTTWAEYDQEFPRQSIEQFCQYYLAQQKQVKPSDNFMRSQQLGGLLRTLGRISSAYAFYHRAAMTQTALPSAESFYYLNGLSYLREVRKTELITYLFAEYTTGMEAINRLLDKGYVIERVDPTDKRAKLIQLTDEGRQALTEAYRYSSKAAEMIFTQIADDTVELVESLLKPIEERHTQILSELKVKEFDAMYEQVINGDANDL